ncbi:Vesicle transport v-SNARE 13, partial [Mucuna pruriens]
CVNTHKFGEPQRTLVLSSSSIDSFLLFEQAPLLSPPPLLRSISGDPPIILRVEKLGTMSEVFEGYERQYCELSANLSRQCTAASAFGGEQKKQKLSDIKAGLDDADVLIRKMDLEARSLQPSIKATLLAKLREYKTDLNNLKSEVKRATSTNVSLTARDELMESGRSDTLAVSNDQKGRLLMSTERLNQSSDRIKESRKTMLETEELGVSILQDLHQQRQSLLHANKTLHGVDDNVSKSKKILSAMSRRMSRNKWIVGSLMTALVLAIIIILYFKLTH